MTGWPVRTPRRSGRGWGVRLPRRRGGAASAAPESG
jgi:hypothetical protein